VRLVTTARKREPESEQSADQVEGGFEARREGSILHRIDNLMAVHVVRDANEPQNPGVGSLKSLVRSEECGG
jgi:hypothetical protein